MSKHTPEPWNAETSDFHDGRDIASLCIGHKVWSDICEVVPNRSGTRAVTPEEAIANADRIVLCVNAMSGIASAAPGSVAKLVEAADKAKEQLAYMLSQQHEGSEFYAGCGSECHTRVTELLTALAAITLEGGE